MYNANKRHRFSNGASDDQHVRKTSPEFPTQYGIIADDKPDPVLVAKGFFIIEFRQTTLNSGRIKNYSVILVSQAGIGFIKKLASLIYG